MKGTITVKALVYDNIVHYVPVLNVPVNTIGYALATGRNDESIAKYMKPTWRITDPNGVLVEIYDPAWLWIEPGASYGGRGEKFTLSKKGIYHIDIFLVMIDPNWVPVDVDTYKGDLCTIVEVVPGVSSFAIKSFSKV